MNMFEQFVSSSLREPVEHQPRSSARWDDKPVKRPRQHTPTGCKGVYLHSSNKNRGEPYYLVRVYNDKHERVAMYDGPDFFEACCVRKATLDRRFKEV
jgi:hypothetical protein